MDIRTCVLLLLALLAPPGCAPLDPLDDEPSIDGIAGGVRDRGRHPAVLALRVGDGGLCSGALVAPRAVLTARHCVSETVERVRCPSRARQVLRDLDPRTLSVTNADDGRRGADLARGADLVVPDDDGLCEADIAVLLLDRALPGVTPLRLASASLPAVGARVTVVGYGLRGDSSRAGFGERFLRARVPVWDVTAGEFVTGAAACEGDSGGPALDPETERVLGVVSRGGGACAGADARTVFTRAGVASLLMAEARRRPAWSGE